MTSPTLTQEGTGKVALVTGGAQGIGHGIAADLQARGYTVHIAYRSESKRSRAAGLVGEARVHRAELTHGVEAARVVAEVLGAEGRLDVLVHAVGPYLTSTLEETSAEDFEGMFQGNLMTAVHMVGAARAALRETQGAYLFFGCAGLDRWRARSVTTAYISAKAALLVMVRGLSVEEARHGVRANMISPGFVPHEGAAEDTHSGELHGRIPLGRAAEMREVTEVAAFLVSGAAGHVVGQNLEVAGGWML